MLNRGSGRPPKAGIELNLSDDAGIRRRLLIQAKANAHVGCQFADDTALFSKLS
jgi:hypothetical protein